MEYEAYNNNGLNFAIGDLLVLIMESLGTLSARELIEKKDAIEAEIRLQLQILDGVRLW